MSYLAEQCVIGSLLMDNERMADIHNILEPHMFTSELLGKMYHEFQRGYDRRYEVNLVVIEQRIRSDAFPSSLIIESARNCMAVTTTTANIRIDAEVIANDYKAEKLTEILARIKVTPSNYKAEIRALQEELEVLQDVKDSKSSTLAEITKENKDKYFKEKDYTPLQLGFDKIDDLLGELEGGDMIVIGARPSVGKSAFVTQITSNLAKQGKRIGFFNLEMQTRQVYERFIVSESGIGLTRLRRATRFLGDEKERFDKANEIFENAENIVITTGSKAVSEIRSESKHMDYDIIIIDYLQLLKSDTSYKGNRYAEVGAISKAIKSLAMELNIPIIALSQLNRSIEARETKEPTMADLREAGDIEQDASVIMLLWNLDADNKSKKGCKVEKNRQGSVGKVVLNFNGDLMKFEETQEDIKSASEWKSASDNPFG